VCLILWSLLLASAQRWTVPKYDAIVIVSGIGGWVTEPPRWRSTVPRVSGLERLSSSRGGHGGSLFEARGLSPLNVGASMIFASARRSHQPAHPRPWRCRRHQGDNPRPLPRSNTTWPDGLPCEVGPRLRARSSSSISALFPHEASASRRFAIDTCWKLFRSSRCDAVARCRSKTRHLGQGWFLQHPLACLGLARVAAVRCGQLWPAGQHPGSGAHEVIDMDMCFSAGP